MTANAVLAGRARELADRELRGSRDRATQSERPAETTGRHTHNEG